MFCKRSTVTNEEKIVEAVHALGLCKERCDAVMRKNERMLGEINTDLRNLRALPRPPVHRIRAGLQKRKILMRSIEQISNHCTAIFRNQMTMQQTAVNIQVGDCLRETHDTLTKIGVSDRSIDQAQKISDALQEMTDAVCDMSHSLSQFEADVTSDVDIEEELATLLGEDEVLPVVLPAVPSGPLVTAASAGETRDPVSLKG